MLLAGHGDVYRVYGYGPDGFYDAIEYEWRREEYKELGHAIFAAQTVVKREVDFSYEPDRHQPEEKDASSTAAEKPMPSKDSAQRRFDALLSKLRMMGPKKETPAPMKRGRSIDR
jgi:hypothetical protein